MTRACVAIAAVAAAIIVPVPRATGGLSGGIVEAAATTTVECVDTLADGPQTPTGPQLSYQAQTPERIVDTRSGIGGHEGEVEAGCTLKIDLTDSAVPDEVNTVALSVTGLAPRIGFFTAFPCADGRPSTSNVNPREGTPTAGLVVASLDADRLVCIHTHDDAHIIVDLQGWWGDGPNRFASIEPARVYDTRELPGSIKLPATHVRNVPIGGIAVPLDATAVVANLTVTKAETKGWMTAYPCGVEPPEASNINFEAGEARAVAVIAGLGSGGQLCITTSTTAHFIVDVVGYYAPEPSYGPSATFNAVDAVRLADSRFGTGGWTSKFEAGETRSIDPGNDAATAALVNVIGLNADEGGFLTLYSCEDDVPTGSTLNFDESSPASNLATIELSAEGEFCVFSAAAADVVVDLVGVTTVPTPSPVERLDIAAAGAADVDVWPPFDAANQDYVIQCGADQNSLELEVVPRAGRDATVTIQVAGDDDDDVEAGDGDTVVELVDDRAEVVLMADDLLTVVVSEDSYSFRCLPEDFPVLSVEQPGEPTPGWYLTTFADIGTGSSSFVVVFDHRGVPVWYKRGSENVVNAQRLVDGRISYAIPGRAFGFDPNNGVRITDLTGELLDEVFMSNPTALPLDHHEQLQRGDGWTLLSYPLVTNQDLTAIGPGYAADESIVDGVLEEIAADGTSVWQWTMSTYFGYEEVRLPIRFANYPDEPNGGEVDVFHINSVEPVDDGTGDYVVSARHLDAIFRVDRATSAVDWILGSIPSDPLDPGYIPNMSGAPRLTIVDDPRGGPLRPHDARLDGNVLTLHDNRSATPQPARVVAYEIDAAAGTATLLWAIEEPQGRTSGALGAVRVADDNSKLITWGALQPTFVELDADDNTLLAISQLPDGRSYRMIKYGVADFDIDAMRINAGGDLADPDPPPPPTPPVDPPV